MLDCSLKRADIWIVDCNGLDAGVISRGNQTIRSLRRPWENWNVVENKEAVLCSTRDGEADERKTGGQLEWDLASESESRGSWIANYDILKPSLIFECWNYG